MKAILFIVAASLIFAAGCSVGPDYHPPKTDTHAEWASPLAGGTTNAPMTDTNWWKTFHDPEIDSLIARAVHSNLNLRVATARVHEERAARGVVAADFWPTANASGSYTRERLSGNGFPEFPPGEPLEANVYQAGFDARWEIDVFGGTRRAVEAATAEIGAAEFGRRDVLVSLLGDVARSYVEARGFQKEIAIVQQNIKAQQDVLELTRDRFKSGLTSDLDVQQAAALLSTTQAQVPTLETGFRQSTYRLDVLIGQRPGTLLEELSAEQPIPSVPPQVPIGLPADLLRRRPDIRRAERQLAASNARIGVAVADYFPKFSLTGDAGLQSVSASDWFTGGSRFWSIGPTAQWRIFDGGRIRSNVKVQNAREEQALATYEQAVLGAFQDVEGALVAYAKEQIRRQSLIEAVTANQNAVDIANQLYKNGLADFLRVLDSQRSLYEAQDALVQSDRTVSVDLIALYKALGGGWEEVEREAMK
ncbi:MAG TPA: efflux transporter outer membrane subunit [Verrucomicrobiae bacterium]|jgi:NodT family efflux transporter outer membrane factor (OMF) lipoprotein|nr:efflux transporter outer membrane subunit [Verrucomicrobiae bacterium]